MVVQTYLRHPYFEHIVLGQVEVWLLPVHFSVQEVHNRENLWIKNAERGSTDKECWAHK